MSEYNKNLALLSTKKKYYRDSFFKTVYTATVVPRDSTGSEFDVKLIPNAHLGDYLATDCPEHIPRENSRKIQIVYVMGGVVARVPLTDCNCGLNTRAPASTPTSDFFKSLKIKRPHWGIRPGRTVVCMTFSRLFSPFAYTNRCLIPLDRSIHRQSLDFWQSCGK